MAAMNGIRALIIDKDNKFFKSVNMVLPILKFEGALYILAIMVFMPNHSAKMALRILNHLVGPL